MTNYIEQAENFCKEFGVTIEVVYSHTGKHFADDKENRDIYNVTIKRGKNKYTFAYGDSINNTEKREKAQKAMPSQRARIGFKKPSAYDILACMQKYDIGDFDDFVSEFGYEFYTEREYIKIKQLYLNIKDEYKNVYKLFSDCMDELQEIQ